MASVNKVILVGNLGADPEMRYPLEVMLTCVRWYVAATESVKADGCVDILMLQNKYLNNIVEQDHLAIKGLTQPMFELKSFWSAQIAIAGIEKMHVIRKGRMNRPDNQAMSAANKLYSSVA